MVEAGEKFVLVVVGAEALLEGEGAFGGGVVELPGVGVEDGGAVLTGGLLEGGGGVGGGEEAEVSAAGGGEVAGAELIDQRGKFDEVVAGMGRVDELEEGEGCGGGVGKGVGFAEGGGEEGGVVGVAGLGDEGCGPGGGSGGEGEGGGAVAEDGLAGLVFESVFSGEEVLFELVGRELVEGGVVVAVGRDFVAEGGGAGGEVGVAFGGVAEDEEGGFDVVMVEEFEKLVEGGFEAGGLVVPGVRGAEGAGGLGVVEVFDVDGEAPRSGGT